jgi:hypothetical protein
MLLAVILCCACVLLAGGLLVQNAYVLSGDCSLCSVSGDSSLNSVQFSMSLVADYLNSSIFHEVLCCLVTLR